MTLRTVSLLLGAPVKGPERHVAAGRDGLRHGVGRLVVAGFVDQHDGNIKLAGELKVALIVRGNRHNRAGTVACQDVVGDPDRDRLVVDRVDRIGAGEDAGLGALGALALDIGGACGPLPVLFDFGLMRPAW